MICVTIEMFKDYEFMRGIFGWSKKNWETKKKEYQIK